MKYSGLLLIIFYVTTAGIIIACGSEKVPDPPRLIVLVSEGCEPCVKAKPLIDEVKRDFSGRMSIREHELNSSEGVFFASGYRITMVPALLILNSAGFEIGRVEGDLEREPLLEFLEKAITAHYSQKK